MAAGDQRLISPGYIERFEAICSNHTVSSSVQGFHLGQVPKGSIRQLANAVSLQLEDFQAGQTLEGQPLHLTYAVPVQLTAKDRKKKKAKTLEGREKNH